MLINNALQNTYIRFHNNYYVYIYSSIFLKYIDKNTDLPLSILRTFQTTKSR